MLIHDLKDLQRLLAHHITIGNISREKNSFIMIATYVLDDAKSMSNTLIMEHTGMLIHVLCLKKGQFHLFQ